MRATTLAAGGLACAGAAMTIAAFAGGGSSDDPPSPASNTRAAAGSPAPDGLSVWIANGCGSCHTFEAANSKAPIGPDLGQSLHNKDRAYIERAIVAPNTDVAAGFGGGGMPEDFATRISPPDLQLLVDFIVEGVRAQ